MIVNVVGPQQLKFFKEVGSECMSQQHCYKNISYLTR